MPSVPKYFLVMVSSLLCRLHCSDHSNYVNRLGHIVHPHDLPLLTARAASARLPYSRSPTGRPSTPPIMLLRDTPTSSGRPSR